MRHVAGGLFDPRVPAREALDRVRRWWGGRGLWYHPVRLATSTHVAIFSPAVGGQDDRVRAAPTCSTARTASSAWT